MVSYIFYPRGMLKIEEHNLSNQFSCCYVNFPQLYVLYYMTQELTVPYQANNTHQFFQ